MAKVYANAYRVAAEEYGKSSDIDRRARKVLDIVRAQAMLHKDTGAYLRGLKVENTPKGKDRLVVSESYAAIAIEFGGLKKTGEYVKPVRIMRNAYAKVKRID